MKLSKEDAIKYHRELWKWLSNHVKSEKEDFPKFLNGEHKCFNTCYCCEYAANVYKEKEDPLYDVSMSNGEECIYCPIDWESKMKSFQCMDKEYPDDNRGLFSLFLIYKDPFHYCYDTKLASELAKEISELKEIKNGRS